MNSFSGRRPNDRAKRIGRGILEGLSVLGTAMSDAPKKARIEEIDSEIERLQHEKDTLIASLIEPGDLKVSDNYDPHKAVFVQPARAYSGEGRLTQCKGQWSASSTIHDCHPGCPYLGTKHIAHEFTLRD